MCISILDLHINTDSLLAAICVSVILNSTTISLIVKLWHFLWLGLRLGYCCLSITLDEEEIRALSNHRKCQSSMMRLMVVELRITGTQIAANRLSVFTKI